MCCEPFAAEPILIGPMIIDRAITQIDPKADYTVVSSEADTASFQFAQVESKQGTE